MAYDSYQISKPEVGSGTYPADFYTKFEIVQQLLDDINASLSGAYSSIYTDLDELLTAIGTDLANIKVAITDPNPPNDIYNISDELSDIYTILELLFDTVAVSYKDNVVPADSLETFETLSQFIFDNPGIDAYYKYNNVLGEMQWVANAGIAGGPYPIEEGGDTELNSIPVFDVVDGTSVRQTQVIITTDNEMYGNGIYIDPHAGSFTVDPETQKGMVFTMTGTSTITLPNPANDFCKGYQATVINRGTGTITIDCISGASAIETKLKTGNSYPVMDGEHSACSIIWLDSSTWGVYGDLVFDTV